jgi:ribokinase
MPTKKPKVVVVGGTYVDTAIRCEHFPEQGSSVSGTALSYTIGGPGPIQAAQAALCGCEVHLISKVGGDPFASMVRDRLEEQDVCTDLVFSAEAMNTGTIVTLVNSEGENASCIYTGANSAISGSTIQEAEEVIAAADACLIHGGLSEDAIVAAIRCSELYGTRVILNPAGGLNRAEGTLANLPDEYFMVNILVTNLYEAADITERGEANLRTAKIMASDFIARGVQSAVITMGKRGSEVVDRSSSDHIPAFEINLVDHTGTGDAFSGALAAYYAVQPDIREAVKFASAAGALVCTRFGAIEALPSKAEIIELLQQTS